MNNNSPKLSQTDFRVQGMTCASCEVILERSLKKAPGIHKVAVDHSSGRGTLWHEAGADTDAAQLQKYLPRDSHYRLYGPDDSVPLEKRDWKEIIVAIVGVLLLYPIFKSLGVFSGSLAAGSGDSLTLGAVFLVGVVAALSSCTAIIGGLILSFSARYAAAHPQASGLARLKPHFYFNAGRLASYFVLGGVVGSVGGLITPSARFTGILTVFIALVMIVLAIDILKLFRVGRFLPKLPKSFSHRLHTLAESDNPFLAFVGGALTFFLPCGFTQSMQLYALTTGSFLTGGLVMFVFALGTLPALFSIGAVASFSRGSFARYFTKFSGVFVILFGLYTLNNGMNLLGFPLTQLARGADSASVSETAGTVVPETDGKQVVKMAVDGINYVPATLKIKKGVPVEWRIDGSGATGCTSVLVIPSLKINKNLSPQKETVIKFTPLSTGTIPFTCGMGMANGKFVVID